MILKEWKYENKIVRDLELDKFYCDKLNRTVDLGWDRLVSTVHWWVSSLNELNRNLYKKGFIVRSISMNKYTFDLLKIDANDFYDSEECKLGAMNIIILDEINDNEVQVSTIENVLVGKLIINKKD